MAALPPDVEQAEVFLDGFRDVEWVDDVTACSCTRCRKVLVQHYISNCDHKFCCNCKRVMDDGSRRWRCPECKEFIQDMERQDFEFRNKVFELRLHCLNWKYGCQHICPFKDLREHLAGCEHTKERALPVLYERGLSVEMLERMFSNQIKVLRQEMQEMKQEVEKRVPLREVNEEQKGVNESAFELNIVVQEMKREMNRMVEKQKDEIKMLRAELFLIINDRVDGVKSDLAVETTRLKNEIKEIQKPPMRNDSSEGLSLAKEENKAKILELKGKTDTWVEIMDFNNRKNIESMHKLETDLKAKQVLIEKEIEKVKQTMSETNNRMTQLLREEGEKREEVTSMISKNNSSQILELKVKVEVLRADVKKNKTEVVTIKTETDKRLAHMIEKLNEKTNRAEMTQHIKRECEQTAAKITLEIKAYADDKVKQLMAECIQKITKLEENNSLIKSNESAQISYLEQKVSYLESCNLLRNPQMSEFTLAENKSNFQPDLNWKITQFRDKMQQKTFKIESEVFEWIGYPVRARAKFNVSATGNIWLSLCLEEQNKGKTIDVKLLPHVYYVLRDRTNATNPKHKCRSRFYWFNTKFAYDLDYSLSICDKSQLIDSAYNVGDSIVMEVYVEPAAMAQMVHAYDGTLNWAIYNYRKRKEMERYGLVRGHDSPYFYTSPKGYRVQVQMYLDGLERSKGVSVAIDFLPGEFDADLPVTFPHLTTITLFNRKDPLRNITKTVDTDIISSKRYYMHMCTNKEIEDVLHNDVIFYKVTIKPSN